MSTNKHASIRYNTLDKCFRNPGRRYYIEDLVEVCNKALYEFAGILDGIKKRQIFDDIAYMESDAGWSIELDRVKDGRRVYYRYSNKDFSISNKPLNETEINQLNEALNVLSRFKGMPQFDWIQEMTAHLKSSLSVKENTQQIVGFEMNPYLKGMGNFSGIFNAILNKQVLKLTYKEFDKEAYEIICHPYYLKQYNNRWFLFGKNSKYDSKRPITNWALDRIKNIVVTKVVYIDNIAVDFDEYFEDVVGVTVNLESPTERVLLKVENHTFNYIETKPLHGSQKIKERSDSHTFIELNVKLNYELETLILGFADRIEILEPIQLRESIKNRANKVLSKNL